MRRLIVHGVVVALLALATACSSASGPQHVAMPSSSTSPLMVPDPTPETVAEVERVEVGRAGATVAALGAEVRVPADAVPAGETVQVVVRHPIGKHAGEIFGPSVEILHRSPLALPLRLSWSISALTAEQRSSLVLTRWDATVRAWQWTPEPVTIVGDTITVEVRQFSILNWIADLGQWVGEHTGARAGEPQCNGRALPSWVKETVDPDQGLSAAAIRVCFEPDRNDVVTVRVVNNRTFTQRLTITDGGQAWAWTWPGVQTYGASAIVYLGARPVFDSPTTFLVPPLTEVTFGIDRPNAPGPAFIKITSYVDFPSVLVDVASYVVDHLHIDFRGNPLAGAFVQALLECGGKEVAGVPSKDGLEAVAQAAVRAVGTCSIEMMRPASTFGARYEALVQQAIRANPVAADTLAKSHRVIHEIAGKFALIQAGQILFYLSDQASNAIVGPLSLAIRGSGRPQDLGAWSATCGDAKTDSNLLYRNLALQDRFSDTSKEFWQFPDWNSATKTAVKPLSRCSAAYLRQLADYLPGSWADKKAAGIVAAEIRALAPAAPAPPAVPPTLPCPGASTFFSAYNRANGPQNVQDYFHIVRGPRCASGWAAAYGTTGVNGSGGEMTRCAWEVLRQSNGQWTYYDLLFQFTQPCDPSHPDSLHQYMPTAKMCRGEVPAAIRSFLGC